MDDFEKLVEELSKSYPDEFVPKRMLLVLVKEIQRLREHMGKTVAVQTVPTAATAKAPR